MDRFSPSVMPALVSRNDTDLLHRTLPKLQLGHRRSTPGTPVTPSSPSGLSDASSTGEMQNPSLVVLPLIGAAGIASDPNTRFRHTNEDAAAIHPALFPDKIFCDESCRNGEDRRSPSAVDESTLDSLHPLTGVPSAFLAVYDGHGGAAVAHSAASELHGKFAHHLSQLRKGTSCAKACVSRAFGRAYAELDAELRGARMFQTGSTAVTCFVYADETDSRKIVTTANVGDARAVLCRAGNAIRLSCDHRAGDEEERARIERAGGFVCARRVNGVLEVSRALGDHAFKSVVVCTPSVRETVLCEADEFLLLACDGLWDWIDDDTAVSIASNAFDEGCNESDVARVLVRAALAAGSTDNITVVVARFDF